MLGNSSNIDDNTIYQKYERYISFLKKSREVNKETIMDNQLYIKENIGVFY